MRMLVFAVTAVAGLAIFSLSAAEAQAGPPNGFHFRSGPVHIDIGHVHHGRRGGFYGSSHRYSPYGYHPGYFGRGHHIGNRTTHYPWYPQRQRSYYGPSFYGGYGPGCPY